MRTSPLRPKKPSDGARTRRSFALACSIYAPLAALAVFGWPQTNYTPAGEPAAVTLTLAQIASAQAAVSSAPEAPEAPEDPADAQMLPAEPEPVAEPEPEPVVEPEPAPAPRLEPKPEKTPEPKPEPKPKPQPRPEKKLEKPVEHQIEKPLEKPSAQTSDAVREDDASKDAPAKAGEAAAAAGSSGISTLVYGETEDPFLSSVKTLVERNLTYPRQARRMRHEGVAIVQFTVAEDGRLSELALFESSGRETLDREALRAVEKARAAWNAPGRTVRLRLPVAFRLKRA